MDKGWIRMSFSASASQTAGLVVCTASDSPLSTLPHSMTPAGQIRFGDKSQIRRVIGRVREIDIFHSETVSVLTTLLHLDNYFSRLFFCVFLYYNTFLSHLSKVFSALHLPSAQLISRGLHSEGFVLMTLREEGESLIPVLNLTAGQVMSGSRLLRTNANVIVELFLYLKISSSS